MSIATTKRPTGPDLTVYPVDDGMPESTLQHELAELLRPLVARHLARMGVRARVGSNQFVYWTQYSPTSSVGPDIYVLPGVAPDLEFGAWKVWESGVVPSFALEVVSTSFEKDYEQAPRRYAELGVKELIVFDPQFRAERDRCRWQVFRALPRRGFALVERSDADRVRSKVLSCWLRDVPAGALGPSRRLRLGVGPRGDDLVPTEAEEERAAKEVERAAKEVERAAKEVERAAKEVERARREEAEAEVARLRGELELLPSRSVSAGGAARSRPRNRFAAAQTMPLAVARTRPLGSA